MLYLSLSFSIPHSLNYKHRRTNWPQPRKIQEAITAAWPVMDLLLRLCDLTQRMCLVSIMRCCKMRARSVSLSRLARHLYKQRRYCETATVKRLFPRPRCQNEVSEHCSFLYMFPLLCCGCGSRCCILTPFYDNLQRAKCKL